jgi:hypothetical protein
MAHTDEIPATRVVSPDGTEIAYFTSGGGPPLLRALAAWQARIAAVHTALVSWPPRRSILIRRGRSRCRSSCWWANTARPNIQAGPDTVAAALPDSRIAVLKGQQHVAMDLIPQTFAETVLGFLVPLDPE